MKELEGTQFDLSMLELAAALRIIGAKRIADCRSDDEAVLIYLAHKKLKNQHKYRLEMGE